MEKELVDIVLQKSFIELSKDDRVALSEWCTSEEEYDQMKNVFLEVERMKLKQTATVRPQTKKSLDALFMEKHHKAPVFWNNSVMTLIYPVDKPLHRRPLIQVAAVALLFLLAYPIVNNNRLSEPTVQTAKNQVKNTVKPSVVTSDQDSITIPVTNKAKKEIHSAPVLVASNESLAEETIVGSTSTFSFSSPLSTSPAWSSPGATSFIGDIPAAEMTISGFGNHPDGVFDGETISAFSEPVSEDPEILDLLTVAF